MIFYTDENISKYAAYMLRIFEQRRQSQAHHQIIAHLDKFKQGIPDIEWMKEIASWNDNSTTVAVCGDGRILKNKAEKQVLKECNLMFVYLAPGWTNLQWPEFAWKIIKIWPDIVRNVEQANCPMLFEVASRSLKIKTMGHINSL